jgi:hypothetical protein
MHLRLLLYLCLVVAVTSVAAPAGAGRAGAQRNPIEVENSLPGTALGAVPRSAVGRVIEGYASETSALPGNTLHFHVSTDPAAAYRVEVYRLGWYGGAGARLIGCTPSCAGSELGRPLPVPVIAANGLVQAGWPVTDTFALPADATSGYYRIRFVLLDGRDSATYVIVRAPAGDQAAILVQVPVNTWQAYNGWGGRSLYNLAGGVVQANRVSFDRPYGSKPLIGEYPLVLFLERQGYDVSYQTDLDTDSDPSSLLGHRLVIVAGHSEYWTQAMRNAFDAARDAGVNLAFMGSNDAYWRARYEDGGRTLVVYKSGDDPIGDQSQRTGLFRVVDHPECELIGIQHQGGKLNWPSGDYAVVPSSLDNSWFRGTGFDTSSVVRGVVGVETDTIPRAQSADSSCGNKLTVFFHREMGGDTFGNADAVAYTAPSGAVVFAAGSKRFALGLADGSLLSGLGHGLVDPRLQRFVSNMLDDLSARYVADLSVALSTTRAKVGVGRTFKVVAVVSNGGPDPASAATLDLALPSGLTFVRVASTAAKCTITPLHCALSQIPVGSSVSAVFTLRATTRGSHRLTGHASTLIATDPRPASAIRQVTIHSSPAPEQETPSQ